VGELVGIARFRIHDGKLEEFKRLSAEAMEIVKTKDTGTLRYDTYFNADESECVILEIYRDSQVAMEHAGSPNSRRRSSRRSRRSTASSSVSRTTSSEPGWRASRSPSSSHRTSRCRDGQTRRTFGPMQLVR
jgi:quinol monooxygenase YgiN